MHKNIAIVTAMLALLALCQGSIAQKKDKEPVKASPGDYTELCYTDVTGKLLTVDDKSASLRVEFPTWVPNPAFKPGSLKLPGHLEFRYNQLIREQGDILRIKNLAERQRRAIENQRAMERLNVDIARHFASDKSVKDGPYKSVMASRDFDLTFDPKVSVRWVSPPTVDEKGAPKIYGKEDLDKLKSSDPKVPGYEGFVTQLSAGQTVTLYLNAPAKDAKKTDDKKTDKAPDKKTDKAPDKTTDKAPDKTADPVEATGRPTVRMILIQDPASLTDAKK